jgi:serine/threonine protein kinase
MSDVASPQFPKKSEAIGVEDGFVQKSDLVNPPEEQIEEALNVAEEHSATVEAGAERSGQLVLPQFTPPVAGLTVTSMMTGNTYTIGPVFGEGAFGTVYEATDVWFNELAVKVLKPRGTYQQIQQAASNEFVKLLQLRHSHVTHVVDAFEFQHTFYIVTERCCAPLSDLFRMEHLNGPVWVRPVARCLLQAVHFLHVAGYVHQDIHFGNIFMQFHRNEMGGDDSNPTSMTFKLADLGIAKLFTEIDAQNTLLNGSMLPPEFLQPAQFGQLGHQVDIYHCGLLFLQLYLGKPLAFSNEEILAGVPRQMAEQLSPPFDTALSKALRRHVAKRTQSALELWRDLTVEVSPLVETLREQIARTEAVKAEASPALPTPAPVKT